MKQLSILLLLTGMISCEKLTPLTDDGRNTMSCKIDGEVFIAEHVFDLSGIDSPNAKLVNGSFTLSGSEKQSKKGLSRYIFIKIVLFVK